MQVENKPVKLKRKRRKNSFMGYIYLFIFVFVLALAGLSYIVKSYSPEVDVTLGNIETEPLTQADMGMEVKSVDERLKWIQMEDEMPSVAIREAKESTEEAVKAKTKKVIEPEVDEEPIFKKEEKIPQPSMSEIANSVAPEIADFRTASAPNQVVPLPVNKPSVIPAPIPSLTKVYLGSFSTVDEAMAIQQKVATDIPDAMPFIKSVNGSYIVQLGSFSNSEIAQTFIQRVRDKGYSPKIMTNN